MIKCECEWKYCGHKGRETGAADFGDVVISPALCTACLYVCCGEADDEADALAEAEGAK